MKVFFLLLFFYAARKDNSFKIKYVNHRLGNLFLFFPTLSLLIFNPHSAIQCRSFSLSHNHIRFFLSLSLSNT